MWQLTPKGKERTSLQKKILQRSRDTQREAGLGAALLPKKDPLAWLLIISLSLVNLNGALSTATNITKWKPYLIWLLWELNKYKVSITTAGTKKIKYYYYLMLRKTKWIQNYHKFQLYLHVSLESHLHLIPFRIIMGYRLMGGWVG